MPPVQQFQDVPVWVAAFDDAQLEPHGPIPATSSEQFVRYGNSPSLEVVIRKTPCRVMFRGTSLLYDSVSMQFFPPERLGLPPLIVYVPLLQWKGRVFESSHIRDALEHEVGAYLNNSAPAHNIMNAVVSGAYHDLKKNIEELPDIIFDFRRQPFVAQGSGIRFQSEHLTVSESRLPTTGKMQLEFVPVKTKFLAVKLCIPPVALTWAPEDIRQWINLKV